MGRSMGMRARVSVLAASAIMIAACTSTYEGEEPIPLPTRNAQVGAPGDEPAPSEPVGGSSGSSSTPTACTAGATETMACDGKNACTGQKTRACQGGTWGSYGACTGATGACTPGASRNVGCGCNGTRPQACTTSCAWADNGSCGGESCPGGHLCTGSSCCNNGCGGLTCGATNGCGNVCNPGSGCTIPCSNECTPGTYRCLSDDVWQECGNFDGDSCTEWGGGGSCYAQGKACSMGICFT